MSTDSVVDMMTEEYNALRDEILKRLEFRYQLIGLNLVVAGTFLSVGLQKDISSSVLLIYPLLAYFLFQAIVGNGIRIMQLANYIREEIEPQVKGLGWERFFKKNYRVPSSGLGRYMLNYGLFPSMQLLSIGLALLKFSQTTIEWILLVVSIASVVLTLSAIRSFYYLRHS